MWVRVPLAVFIRSAQQEVAMATSKVGGKGQAQPQPVAREPESNLSLLDLRTRTLNLDTSSSHPSPYPCHGSCPKLLIGMSQSFVDVHLSIPLGAQHFSPLGIEL